MTQTTDVATSLPLRDYQEAAISAIVTAWENDTKRPAVVLPTGSGKTVVFAHLIAQMRPWRTLVLVHRDELINQTASKIHDVAPGICVGVVKAGRNDVDADVIIASVQTLHREHRLSQISDVHLVIVDECHHAAADSYRTIMNAMGERGAVFAGFTATMDRADKKSLGEVWDDVVFTEDILDMIAQGHLVNVSGKMVQIDGMSLADVKTSRGDYQASSLSDMLLTNDACNLVADSYKEHASDRQGILFAPTVESARLFTSALNARGIPTETVWGGMVSDERRQVLANARSRRTQVLSNCMVLTEGFDLPQMSACVIARPTKSASLYVQMVGRVLRPSPGKSDALVLDVVGASQEHELATLADLSAKRIDTVLPGETIIDAAKRRAKQGATGLQGYINFRDVDLFHSSRIMWLQTHKGTWFIAGSENVVFLWPGDGDERYRVGIRPIRTRGGKWLREDMSLEYAMQWAEKAVSEMDEGFITSRKASWRRRNEKPSIAQTRLASIIGVTVPDGVTKAVLSDLITVHTVSKILDPR